LPAKMKIAPRYGWLAMFLKFPFPFQNVFYFKPVKPPGAALSSTNWFHWQENAEKNPYAVVPAWADWARVIIVPAACWEPVAVHFVAAPVEAVVEQLAILLPSDQTSVAFEGVTASRFHVIATPRYEVIVILGVQAAGVITVPIGVRELAPSWALVAGLK
jgi:hypothetical protein